MKMLMIGLVAWELAFGVRAQEVRQWMILASTGTAIFAVDRSTVKREGDRISFWVTYAPSQQETADGVQYDFQVQLWNGECASSRSAPEIVYFHSLDGDLVDIRESKVPLFAAPPNSSLRMILDRVCSDSWGDLGPLPDPPAVARVARRSSAQSD